MKKEEIRLRVADFKTRESELILKLNEDASNKETAQQMVLVRKHLSEWLYSIIQKPENLSDEEREQLDQMVEIAMNAILRAGKLNAVLAKSFSDGENISPKHFLQYESLIKENSRKAFLAEQNACDKVLKIDKLNKKKNRNNFLNVVICKFRKSKQQSQESDKGPSGPVNG